MKIRRFLIASAVLSLAVTPLSPLAPASATFAGHNGKLVFSVDNGTGFQLYTLDPDGTHLRQITHVTGGALAPDWSPDGRRIIFEHDNPDGTEPLCSIAVVNADGTGLTELTHDTLGCDAQPAFTPDRRHILFERLDDIGGADAIYQMDLQGNHRRKITAGSGIGVTDPNPSPDGRTISFLDYDNTPTGAALFTVHADGTGLHQLTSYDTDLSIKHDWSPDGRWIAFTGIGGPSTSAPNVFLIHPDGTGERPLTHYTQPGTGANVGGFSPDGDWIVYRVDDNGLHSLKLISPDGHHQRTLLPPSTLRPRFIDWGPTAQDN